MSPACSRVLPIWQTATAPFNNEAGAPPPLPPPNSNRRPLQRLSPDTHGICSVGGLVGWMPLKQLCFGSFKTAPRNTLVAAERDSSSMKSHQTIIGHKGAGRVHHVCCDLPGVVDRKPMFRYISRLENCPRTEAPLLI